jgi:hypothetical protein
MQPDLAYFVVTRNDLMKLKKYHCEDFEIRLRTARAKFAHQKFFKDPRLSEDLAGWEGGEPLNLNHCTGNPRISDYHVHLQLRLIKGIVRLTIRWVEGILEKSRGTEPPFAEDVPDWISRFFSKDLDVVNVFAHYSFQTSKYASALELPIPLIMPTHRTKSSTIVGMTFLTQLRGASRVTIETELLPTRSLWVMIFASYKGRLLNFAPGRLLPEFSKLIDEHIIKR